MNDPRGEGPPPQYKVYRSRQGLLDRLRPGRGEGSRLRCRKRGDREPGEIKPARRRFSPRRVLKYVLLAALGWILLSMLLFAISAQIEERNDEGVEKALSGDGNLFSGATVLVLGSDMRSKDTDEPGSGGAARADSILLLRAQFGEVRRLSIPRDTLADIPGSGPGKINSAYAAGGAALLVDTIEGFLGNGVKIDHVVEVSFEEFPELIDALGGIEVKLKRCLRSEAFGGRPFKLPKGEHRLNGRQALAFARVRKNACSPNEDDRARAARQQQVLTSMRSQVTSPKNWPFTFVRLPFIAWKAPKALNSDLAGVGMGGLFLDLLTGGSGKTRVLKNASGVDASNNLIFSNEEKARAARYIKGR